MAFSLIYITAANIDEARRIARTIVEKRLVACANIVPRIESFYWWQGKICEDEEVLIFAKTEMRLVKEVLSEVKGLHSYEVPAILSFDISEGNPDFLDWIAQEVK
ncbi:MAG: divalent-cation tolerance protein CutA [Actinomycetota bacterium]|nr:divalent-cation tolerance protein CutA [Actinomycetota bacterium]MDI6822640.1 divalent-cation tolerance protein CutA [Actinomycetota bacterium]